MPQTDKSSISDWWRYEVCAFKNAQGGIGMASLWRSIAGGMLMAFGQYLFGLKERHETVVLVLLCLGAALVVFLFEFAIKLFGAPVKMAKELEAKNKQLIEKKTSSFG